MECDKFYRGGRLEVVEKREFRYFYLGWNYGEVSIMQNLRG